ncbi:MAG TPA: hypothetical protein VMH87_00680 [Pseudomonadales bacterium]|nr:hypothetical protein [Pseudomonadales bacterium]
MKKHNELMAFSVRRERVSGQYSTAGALKKMNEFVEANKKVPFHNGMTKAGKQEAYEQKAKLALEAALFFKRELLPFVDEWESMRAHDIRDAIGLEASALEAGDYVDPNGNLGTFSGTLVMQRALPVFAFEYPELPAMFTDFSPEPGFLNQASDSRIISIPAVQKFNPNADATGRPEGWSTVSPAVTQDVPITLTDFIAVPIVFGQNLLSSTQRDLFGEMAEAGMKAIAGYFTGMMTKLLTVGNFNAYAQLTNDNPQSVPVAYSSYARNLGDFSMGDLDKLSAIFTQNKVPRGDRGILLSPQYYARLRSDPRLEFFFAATAANPVLTQQKLPDGLSGFFPYEAPYLPGTNNLTFFPFHKAGIVLKQRLPSDFTKAMPNTPLPGTVTTVIEPDTKISVALVQYVNLTQEYAEWRPETILGAGLGDTRGGLCGTSQ